MSVKIISVKDGVERKVEVVELPIRWEPVREWCHDTDEEYITGWFMFIPQVVDGHEIGGIHMDIEVTLYGELTGMGEPMRFDSIYEAQAYAEATYKLLEANDGT